MKRIVVLLALFLANAVTGAPLPWVSQTGLTATQLGDRVTRWADEAYSLSPACVSGYEEAGAIRYAALWGPRTDDDARLVLVGRTASELTTANALQQLRGYRLVWLSGFESGGVDYYNAIYRRTSGAAQVLRLGDSLSAHQAADASLSGHYLENLCVFRSGSNVRYGAWWVASAIAPQIQVSYGLTSAEYQTEFNQRSGAWRLHSVCGYAPLIAGTGDRYTVLWRRPARTEDWAAAHGMAKLNYFAEQGNQTMTGRRPILQQAWASGSEIRFNGIWVENGGLADRWVSELDRNVAEHMRTNGIPGVTLAVSRRGQLIYAKGYGLADVEAGELAGPEHRFRIASVSKPVCAVTVLHALERSPRSLASRLFGSSGIFSNDYGTPPYTARELAITVRHVLNHTAGWSSDGKLWWDDEPAWGSDHKPIIDYQLDSVSQPYDPGKIGRYSNLGYVIAARVVEKLTGRTYEDYAVNEVLAACGISGVTRMAIGERTRPQQQFMEAAYYPHATDSTDPYTIDPRRMDGSTAWIAKPSDLLLLARRMDGNSTHTDILTQASVDDMKTPGSPDSSTGYGYRTYGLGWSTDDINNPTQWGHNGGMAGTTADFIVREDGVSFAWMSNTRAGDLDSTIGAWITRITQAGAWPDIDLFSSAHPDYDAWASTNFSTLDRGQPGLRISYFGPDADPDGDQITNAGEAYHGLDPLARNASPLSVAKVGGNLRVRWQRSLTERGVKVGVLTSPNMVNWAGLIGVTITDRPDLISAAGKMFQEVLIPISGHHRFVSLSYRTH